jgi:tetratricopeptide (TPR) repeat protein
MVRCSSFSKQSLFIPMFFGFFVFLFPGPSTSSGQTYRFRSESPSLDRKSDATVSVRDLSIPPKAFAAYQHGLQKLHKGDNTHSIRDFNKAIEKFPQFYEAYYHLGVAQKRLGQNDKALSSFQTAINLSGGKYA